MEVWIPPVVDNLLKAYPDEDVIRRLITEVSEDTSLHKKGQLAYDGHLFTEYKSGGHRIFAVFLGTKMVVCLFGNHQDDKYVGGAYDGAKKFPAIFNNKQLNAEQAESNAVSVIKKIYGLNTTKSPFPIFD